MGATFFYFFSQLGGVRALLLGKTPLLIYWHEFQGTRYTLVAHLPNNRPLFSSISSIVTSVNFLTLA